MTEQKHLATSLLLRVAAVSLAYFLAGRLALLLAIPPGYATATWPAAGVALVALLVWGYRVLPGILVGSFLTNIWTTLASGGSATGAAILIATSIGMGAALQGFLGAWLIHRFIGYPNPLVRERDIVKFLGLGGPVGCLVGATWGVATLRLAGLVPADETALNWMTWWAGDTIGVLTCAPLLLVLFGQPRNVWRSRSVSVALPTVVAFALVVVVYIGASRWEQNSIDAEFRQRCTEQAGAVRRSCDESMKALNLLASLFKGGQEVTREEFGAFSRHILEDYKDVLGLTWIPRVPGVEREAFERETSASGFPGFQIMERTATCEMVPASQRDEYFPVYFAEPLVGRERILGFDVSSEPIRRAALHRARDSAKVAATGPIVLLTEPETQPGVLAFHPIYASSAANAGEGQGKRDLRGFATIVLKIGTRIDGALGDFDRSGIDLELWDDDAPDGRRLIYSSARPVGDDSASNAGRILPTWSESYEFAGRPRRVVFRATPQYVAAHRSLESWSVLAGGLLFTSLLCTMFLSQSGRSTRIQEVVDEQTADLRKTSELLASLNAELARTSRIDSLTGLLRRQAWSESLSLEHERSLRYGRFYSVVMLDVDQFKMLNDTLGHQHGDECLREVARCVASQCRRTDMVGRYGGEEFVALLVETDRDGAAEWAERLREAIYEANLMHPMSTVADRVTVSIGVATWTSAGGRHSWEKIMAAADGAMYKAKQGGRNRVCVHSEPPQQDLSAN